MEPCNADREASSQTLSDKNLMKVMIMMSRCGIVTHKSYYEALEEIEKFSGNNNDELLLPL